MKIRAIIFVIAVLQLFDIKHVVLGMLGLQPEIMKNHAKNQRTQQVINKISYLKLNYLNAQEISIPTLDPQQWAEVKRDFICSREEYSLVIQPSLFWMQNLENTDRESFEYYLGKQSGLILIDERKEVCFGEKSENLTTTPLEEELKREVGALESKQEEPAVEQASLFSENKGDIAISEETALGVQDSLESQSALVKSNEINLDGFVFVESDSIDDPIDDSDMTSENHLSETSRSQLTQPENPQVLSQDDIATQEADGDSSLTNHPEPVGPLQSREFAILDGFVAAVPSPQDIPAPVPVETRSYSSTFNIQRIFLSYAGATTNNPGYDSNVSTLGILLGPVYKPGHYLPLIDLRGHWYNDSTAAANGGIVIRHVPEANSSSTQVWGVNAFYDFREGKMGDYSQLGLGFESLGTHWDFRANAYIPLQNPTHHKKCEFTYPGGFVSTNHKHQFTFYGANVEGGYYLYQSNSFFLYAAGGVYGWAREGDESVLGGEIRIRPQYRDYIALDLRVTYDPVYNAVFQGELIVSFPLYQIGAKKNKMGSSRITDRQIYQRVERFAVLPYDRSCCTQTNY